MPPLVAMMLAATGASVIFLLPLALADFGGSLSTTSLFAANFYFWNSAGYFAPAAERLPLLHTWSLAVEEQFYILYPPLIILLVRYWPKAIVPVVTLSGAASLLLSAYVVQRAPHHAFFLSPMRAWEIALGAIVCLAPLPPITHKLARSLTAALGFGLIAFSVLTFTSQTPFPGLSALLPCVGAALLIHSGGSGASPVTTLLSTRILVWLGLISYSLYLWHWPLFVFANYRRFEPLSVHENLAIVALSVVIAFLSWRCVEIPFREKMILRHQRALFVAAALCTVAITSTGAILWSTGGLPWRVSPEVAALDGAAHDANWDELSCHDPRQAGIEADRLCRIGQPSIDPSWLVWGDSHAWALKPAIDQWMRETNQSGWISSHGGCPPLLGISRRSWIPCKELNQATFDFIVRHRIARVLLVAAWPGYTQIEITDQRSNDHSLSETALVLDRAIDATLAKLAENGTEIHIFDWVPGAKQNVPDTLARSRFFNQDIDIRMTLAEYKERTRFFDLAFERNARLITKRISSSETLCSQGKCEITTMDGIPLYSDANHPSSRAAPVFAAILHRSYPRRDIKP